MSDNKPTFIQIGREGISYAFHALYIKEADGMYSWYIPAFDIHYSSNTLEEGDKRAIPLTESFFNFWLHKKSYRSFLLQILSLGFKPKNNQELKLLLNRQLFDSRLNAADNSIPKEYDKYELSEKEGNLAIAV